ncbi:MAG: isochorismatase [Planctomycetia bacterium]|nr:isochorismatase [Planctomycetia bacterium]
MTAARNDNRLPLPPHFDPQRVGEVWRVPYLQRALAAADWTARHGIQPAANDEPRTCLLLIDCQNTFCIPGFELYVGGEGERGPIGDCRRLCAFIYGNLGHITEIVATLDTHSVLQIFHPLFLIDDAGQHPSPLTAVSLEDVETGRWQADPRTAASLGLAPGALQRHLLHYCRQLAAGGKYQLMVWPYHALLGGIGHALVSAIEEACFFHAQARHTQTRYEQKGSHPLVESYSALRPEVREDADGRPLGMRNDALIEHLLTFDRIVIAGQAKSHCVVWTVEDLLAAMRERDASLTRKVTLLADCASPVVVPGAVDFTEQGEAAYARFAAAGMQVRNAAEVLLE